MYPIGIQKYGLIVIDMPSPTDILVRILADYVIPFRCRGGGRR
jgi:hypothetical protein